MIAVNIASDIDMDLPAYSAHPETAKPLENIPLPPGIVDNINVTPAHVAGKRDNIVSEYGSESVPVLPGKFITPQYNKDKEEDLFFKKKRSESDTRDLNKYASKRLHIKHNFTN